MTEQNDIKKVRKQYAKPVIARVELVPEQIVLGTCRTSTASGRGSHQNCGGWGSPCVIRP